MNLPMKQQHSQREQTCGYRGGEDGLGSLGLVRAACMLSNFSRVRLFATLWTVVHQAPPPMGFSRQEY